MNKRELIAGLREQRKELRAQLDPILDKAKRERRGLTAVEESRFDSTASEVQALDERIEELETQQRADDSAAEVAKRFAFGSTSTNTNTNGVHNMTLPEKRSTMPGRSGWSVGTEEETYRPDGGNSYFRDLWMSRNYGDSEAAARLARNNAQQAARLGTQQRAISGNVVGAGGEFVPPLWAEQKFVAFARPGRITADLVNNEPLPAGTDLINLPKIQTGTKVAPQTTQNSQVQVTDLTTTSVASPVITIAGGQTVSLQLLEQSPLNMDQVILGDLAADYGVQLNTQVLSGTGTGGQAMGILTLSGTNQIAYSPTTATIATLYSAIANAVQQVHTARFLPPTAIVMHPRRWAYLLAAVDSAFRPLVTPKAGGPFNSVGAYDAQVSQGYVGEMLGLPVYADSTVPTNAGVGTNQDKIIVLRAEDVWLWESNVRAEAFQQTYANNLSVFVRLYNYASFQPARYPASISVISGTGLVPPSF